MENPKSLIVMNQVLCSLSDSIDLFFNVPLPIDTIDDAMQILLEFRVK